MARTSEALLADRRNNAIIGWVLLLFLAVVAVESFITGDLSWGVFVATILVLCLVVPVSFLDREVMLPWEVIAMAALPALGRAIATFPEFSILYTYLSVAALALIVAVQLDLFTSVKLSIAFAILFVTVMTMATAGIWAVFRWSIDLLIGTSTLTEPGTADRVILDQLMVEFVIAMVAGIVAGIVFELYFRRRSQAEERIPEEVHHDAA